MLSLTIHPRGRAFQKDQAQKNMRNKQSRLFIFDAQRLQRIHLKTIEMLKQYFKKIDHKIPTHHEEPFKNESSKSNFQKLRDRFFSLSSDNEPLIAKNLQQMKRIYKDIFRSEQLKQMERKLSRVKASSSSLDRQIKLYEQNLVKELKDSNLQGNGWMGMSINTKIKQEWKKRNQEQVNSYKLNDSNAFFHRNVTTDFQNQKKRIMSNIKKLRQQTEHYASAISSKQKNKLFTIGEQFNDRAFSDYEKENKFVQKAWKPSKMTTVSILSNNQNLHKHRLFKSHDENKKHLQRSTTSKYQGQRKSSNTFFNDESNQKQTNIRNPTEKIIANQLKTGMKLQRKWSACQKQNNKKNTRLQSPQCALQYQGNQFKSSFQTKKSRQVNLRLQKDRTCIQRCKPSRKLIL